MIEINKEVIRNRMAERNIGVTELARLTGLSRQTIHSVLKTGFRPVVPSAEALCEILELEPREAFQVQINANSEIMDLLSQALRGDARAFELLPARIAASASLPYTEDLAALGPLALNVLAAAADLAGELPDDVAGGSKRKKVTHSKNSQKLHLFAQKLSASSIIGGTAFFFGLGLMTPERIVKSTPLAMQRHNVFGAFEIKDFKRHLNENISDS